MESGQRAPAYTKLRDLGLVRRLTKRNVGKPATYIRSDGREQPTIRDKSLVQVVREVVKQPMRTSEVVFAVLDAGWETTMIPGHFRTHVISRLRKAGYREVAGKWVR